MALSAKNKEIYERDFVGKDVVKSLTLVANKVYENVN